MYGSIHWWSTIRHIHVTWEMWKEMTIETLALSTILLIQNYLTVLFLSRIMFLLAICFSSRIGLSVLSLGQTLRANKLSQKVSSFTYFYRGLLLGWLWLFSYGRFSDVPHLRGHCFSLIVRNKSDVQVSLILHEKNGKIIPTSAERERGLVKEEEQMGKFSYISTRG